MDNETLTFCDICGREILCDDEVGDIEVTSQIIKALFHGRERLKTRIVKCIDCIDEEGE